VPRQPISRFTGVVAGKEYIIDTLGDSVRLWVSRQAFSGPRGGFAQEPPLPLLWISSPSEVSQLKTLLRQLQQLCDEVFSPAESTQEPQRPKDSETSSKEK